MELAFGVLSSVRERTDKLRILATAVAEEYNDELTLILNHVALTMELLGPEHPAFEDLRDLQRCAYRCAEITRGLLSAALH